MASRGTRHAGFRIAALVAAFCAGMLAPAVTSAAPERQPRPNVLMLMTDDQTVESLRVMPNVQRLLAARGTTFERSFASFPLCCPSRATFFTGQYAHGHGVLGNSLPTGGYSKLDKSNWLPLWLQRAGYRTVHLGKFLNGYGRENSAPTEVPPGFSEWYGSVDPSTYQYYGYTLNENGSLATYGANGDPAFYQTDFYARRASEIIGRLAPSPEPFFLSVGFLAPHSGGPRDPDDPRNPATPAPAPRHKDRFSSEPLPQPPSFNEADVSDKPRFIRGRRPIGATLANGIRETYQQRLETLLAVDEAVQQILETLRQAGELDNTLVLFTSDNGFFHGEHRLPSGKVWVYEPSIRVPLILRGPGVPAGARRRHLVTNADLAPTILAAAKARPGRPQDGRSLFPLLSDPTREWGRDVLLEGADGGPNAYRAIRTYRFLYTEYASGDRELYDLAQDPFQLQSRHADPAYAPVRDRLAARLAALRTCSGRSCRTRPRLVLRTRFRGRRCVRRRLRARLTGHDRPSVTRVDFFARGRLVARDFRAPFVKRIRRRLRRGRRFRIRARATTVDGRVVTVDRRLRACRRR